MSVEIRNLSYSYDDKEEVLKNIDLNIKDGDFLAIIGKTGSGKTTLMQHINGLILSKNNSVIIDDEEVKKDNLKKIRSKVGYVFQFPEYQLFEDSVIKDVEFAPINFEFNDDEALDNSKKALFEVGINEDLFNKSPFELSGGQKRKVAIAGVLSYHPNILLLDEPTAGLDPCSADEIMNLFKKENEKGNTIIMVTHDMEHVMNYANRVVLLKDGEIAFDGTKDDFFNDFDNFEDYDIQIPKVIELKHALKEKGIKISKNNYVIEDIIKEVKNEK